jgi:hypothetical protein
MKIVEIIVSAGRTFNHPYEQYSNFKPHITLKGSVEEGEDPVACAKAMQQQAESLVEDHKQSLLESIEQLANMQRAERELTDLGRTMARAQERIDQLRKDCPALVQKMLIPAPTPCPAEEIEF